MKKIPLIICISSLVGCQSNVSKNEIPGLLNVSNAEIVNSKGTDDFGGFGEGYTIEFYELSDKTISDFKNKTTKELPLKKDDTAWQKKDWSKTPIDSSYNEIFIMVLNYDGGSKEIEIELKKIKLLVEKPDVYYSFYFKPDKDSPQDIELFILDLSGRKLYTIEINT
ncbi:MAG: hypothetical protein ABWZ25_15120 [Chitinophagaceae bacterium]